MSEVAPDRQIQRVEQWRSWLVPCQLHDAIPPRLRAGALLRWCVVALVAFVAATSPPRLPALAVGWLALASLYNALGQYVSDAVTGRAALWLARGLVVADMVALAGLAAMYQGAPPESLSMCCFLILLEALLWFNWRGVLLSIGLIGTGWTAMDLVDCLRVARGAFPWREFLGDLLTVGVVVAGLVLVLRVLAATVNRARTEGDASRTVEDEALRIRLSAREKEVLALISTGCSNRMIATRLHLAPSTVKSHVESILARLDARNRAEAVAIAARLRLLADAAKDSSGVAEAPPGAASVRPSFARSVSLATSLNRNSPIDRPVSSSPARIGEFRLSRRS
jgi:DNA-binding CsgD family transcriptional regulator